MGLILEKQLSNTKPAKETLAALIATPTKNTMRITGDLANKLGVKVEDLVEVHSYKTSPDAEPRLFIHAGVAPTYRTDADGNVMKNSKGEEIVDVPAKGSILQPQGSRKRPSPNMTFSSAPVWASLDGDVEFRRIFVADDEPTYFDTDENGNPVEGSAFAYGLTFLKEEKKAEKSTVEGGDDDDKADDGDDTIDEPTEEEVTDVDLEDLESDDLSEEEEA